MNRRHRPVTQSDIARAVGLDVTSVSKTAGSTFRESTIREVLQAARQAGRAVQILVGR